MFGLFTEFHIDFLFSVSCASNVNFYILIYTCIVSLFEMALKRERCKKLKQINNALDATEVLRTAAAADTITFADPAVWRNSERYLSVNPTNYLSICHLHATCCCYCFLNDENIFIAKLCGRVNILMRTPASRSSSSSSKETSWRIATASPQQQVAFIHI